MKLATKIKGKSLPVLVEKDEDGFYVVECPLLAGCVSQGRTLNEALENIREVIELCVEEKVNRDVVESYQPRELRLHTVTL